MHRKPKQHSRKQGDFNYNGVKGAGLGQNLTNFDKMSGGPGYYGRPQTAFNQQPEDVMFKKVKYGHSKFNEDEDFQINSYSKRSTQNYKK